MIKKNPTVYADINQLLEILLSSMQKILGEKLVGLYLYGSLVISDFDPTISDIDLMAALAFKLDDREFKALHKPGTSIYVPSQAYLMTGWATWVM